MAAAGAGAGAGAAGAGGGSVTGGSASEGASAWAEGRRGPSAGPAPSVGVAALMEGPSCAWEWMPHHKTGGDLWSAVRREARENSEREPMLASFLYSAILAHETLERALAFILANKLESKSLLSTQLLDIFYDCFMADPGITEAFTADIMAFHERDPACEQYSMVMLYFKGFQAIQTHRVAHHLWTTGRRALALTLQSRASQVFHVDMHPAAQLGKGVMMDHATGVVVGETAEIGDNVSMLHHVTLGGSGTRQKRRHPRVGNGVLLGAGVCILGAVDIGNGTKIGAGSMVMNDIPEHSVAVGVPAVVMGKVASSVQPAEDMDQTKGYIGDWII